jgi:electron transport complex protein RnfC
MMGQTLPHSHVPVVKGCNGIIALTAKEIRQRPVMPCIHCGRCVDVCPVGLLPLHMAAHLRKGDIDGAAGYGLQDCISCGSCSYVCPANIPLVHYFNYGKGEAASRRQTQMRNDKIRKLIEARNSRLEQLELAKAQARAAAAAQKKTTA